jgi:hypothetical protein
VNDKHADWQLADAEGTTIKNFYPVHIEKVSSLTAPPETDLTVTLELAATNISDGALPSTVMVGLLPFELVDTKDKVFDDLAPQGTTITAAMWDVNIEPKKDAKDTNIKSVAWIEPHGADDGSNEPDMPQLALRLRGTEQMGLKIRWKFKVEYKRPSGRILPEDTVKIPAAGRSSEWVTENLDGAVEIFNHADWISAIGQQSEALQAGRGFFGGDVEFTWQLLKSDDSPLGDEQKMLFRIAGKNPDNALCRTYIDQVAQSLVPQSGSLMWYAYAIAKSETKGLGGDPYYNQFLRRGDKYKDRKGSEGRPNWNDDGKKKDGKSKPGGYGVKQVTGYQGNEDANVPRSVIWNWQHNVDEGLRELSDINQEARGWMQRQRNAATQPLPTHTVRAVLFSDGTARIMEDAVAMKRYNGAALRPQPDSYSDPAGTGGFSYTNVVPKRGHYCYWDGALSKWHLSRFNNYKGGFNYVDRVCIEVEP